MIKEATKILVDIEDGNISPVVGYAKLKKMKDFLDKCVKEAYPAAMEEAEKQPKIFSEDGFNFERRNGRRIFNYKNITEWLRAEADKKAIEDKAKKAYALYEKGSRPVDADTGEILPLPSVKYTDDVLIVK